MANTHIYWALKKNWPTIYSFGYIHLQSILLFHTLKPNPKKTEHNSDSIDIALPDGQ